MPEWVWLWLAAALNLSGMAWLALAMDVHWDRVVCHRGPGRRFPPIVLRGLGAAALMLGLGVCLLADRPSMAVLVWLMLMSGAALLVALVLGHRPQWLALWSFGTPFNR
ncbi:MAG TPA: DUF3325 domain-containing protein [Hydrogenophaga sp.]